MLCHWRPGCGAHVTPFRLKAVAVLAVVAGLAGLLMGARSQPGRGADNTGVGVQRLAGRLPVHVQDK